MSSRRGWRRDTAALELRADTKFGVMTKRQHESLMGCASLTMTGPEAETVTALPRVSNSQR
jgi:hypothetical protein